MIGANYTLRIYRFVRDLIDFCSYRTSISSCYQPLSEQQIHIESHRLGESWKNSSLPERQWKLVKKQIQSYREGFSIDVFDVFVKSLTELPELKPGMTLLEVGCSTGYYSEVIEIAALPLKYSGCDYSEDFIVTAREKYPGIDFQIMDATALNHPNGAFDIVVSGCCILHIPNYKKSIEETARVANRYAIFHRTPVVYPGEERWFKKRAYGIETVEIHFNEEEFLSLLRGCGLDVIATYTLSEREMHGSGEAVRTYVTIKR